MVVLPALSKPTMIILTGVFEKRRFHKLLNTIPMVECREREGKEKVVGVCVQQDVISGQEREKGFRFQRAALNYYAQRSVHYFLQWLHRKE